MAEGLYLRNAVLQEFDATAVALVPEGVLLDRTAFYPTGGGQPDDRGTLVALDGTAWTVDEVKKLPSGIVHRVGGSRPVRVGEPLHGRVEWERRTAHTRYHTALHILSGLAFQRFGAGTTGGQIRADGARMDFSLPEFSRELAEELVDGMNEVVARDLPVEVRFRPRADVLSDPSLVRVATELLPEVDEVRLIDIVGFDVQADGGTHVRSTREVGPVRLDRLENKGARNKRLYLTLGAPVSGSAAPR
ncbi:MAG TPA: alanyl-tRNA editing protein [Thermoplasmata archaeon]